MVRDQAPLYTNSFITPKIFKKQLEFLKRNFKIISLGTALEIVKDEGVLKNCLAITFDDGYRECHDIVAPILLEENIPATFFLIEDCIDNVNLMWRDKIFYLDNTLEKIRKKLVLENFSRETGLVYDYNSSKSLSDISTSWAYSLKDEYSDLLWKLSDNIPLDEWLGINKPYLSSSQIISMHDSGFEFGSHTKSHPLCNKLGYDDLKNETIRSSLRLTEKLGFKIDMLSYPFGIRAGIEMEKKLLEENFFTCLLGIDDMLNNKNDPSSWERISLECNPGEDMFNLFLKPLLKSFLRLQS